jgi:hypothetical protein
MALDAVFLKSGYKTEKKIDKKVSKKEKENKRELIGSCLYFCFVNL